jgi:hypothetical protein
MHPFGLPSHPITLKSTFSVDPGGKPKDNITVTVPASPDTK